MNAAEIKSEIERLNPWYSTIELYPEVFTNGYMLNNIGLTRDLLRRSAVKGTNCLDIGAMEGVLSILLKRQGAMNVVAVDGDNRSRKMPLLQATYGVEFQYIGNLALHNTLDYLLNKSRLYAVGKCPYRFGFDIVVLSGVLYHVYSPMHVLAMARSCLKEGGLMIIETAAINEPTYSMRYNFTGKGYLYGWTDTWFMDVPLLDYLCRFLKLEPLDCVYSATPHKLCPNLIRIGVVCRAVDKILNTTGDNTMVESSFNYDYNTLIRHDLTTEKISVPIPFEVAENGLSKREDIHTCDLYATINKRKPMALNENHAVLKLADIY